MKTSEVKKSITLSPDENQEVVKLAKASEMSVHQYMVEVQRLAIANKTVFKKKTTVEVVT